MNIPIKIINAIFVIALLLNSYKIFLIPFQPYNIFPWMGLFSKSEGNLSFPVISNPSQSLDDRNVSINYCMEMALMFN